MMKSLREELENRISDIVLDKDYQEPSMIPSLEGDLLNVVDEEFDKYESSLDEWIDDNSSHIQFEDMVHSVIPTTVLKRYLEGKLL